MIRCCFLGYRENYELNCNLLNQITDELEKLVSLDKCIEFWFTSLYSDYLSTCLSCVLLFKTKHPDCDIKIVRVFDSKYNTRDGLYEAAFSNKFPGCIPDRNVFIQNLNSEEQSDSLNNTQRGINTEYWMVKQCNYIFVYSYSVFPESGISTMIKGAERNKETTVISLGFSDTAAFIRKQINTIPDERQRKVLSMIADGVKKNEIGELLNVSRSRVDQIEDKAGREIHLALNRRTFNNSKNEHTKDQAIICSLIGLKNNASSLNLAMFQSLIPFLIKTYSVNEFWIDEESADTVYGAVLAIYCNVYQKVKNKVVIICEDVNEEEWEKEIERYCPPYSAVVNVVLGEGTWQSNCKEVISNSQICLTDSTSTEYPLIRDFCANAENTRMIDISAKNIHGNSTITNLK